MMKLHLLEAHRVVEETCVPGSVILPASLIRWTCKICPDFTMKQDEKDVLMHIALKHSAFYISRKSRWCKAVCRVCLLEGTEEEMRSHTELHRTQFVQEDEDEGKLEVKEEGSAGLGNRSGGVSVRKDLLEAKRESRSPSVEVLKDIAPVKSRSTKQSKVKVEHERKREKYRGQSSRRSRSSSTRSPSASKDKRRSRKRKHSTPSPRRRSRSSTGRSKRTESPGAQDHRRRSRSKVRRAVSPRRGVGSWWLVAGGGSGSRRPSRSPSPSCYPTRAREVPVSKSLPQKQYQKMNCKICNVVCYGLIPYKQHLEGNLHQENFQKFRNNNFTEEGIQKDP